MDQYICSYFRVICTKCHPRSTIVYTTVCNLGFKWPWGSDPLKCFDIGHYGLVVRVLRLYYCDGEIQHQQKRVKKRYRVDAVLAVRVILISYCVVFIRAICFIDLLWFRCASTSLLYVVTSVVYCIM